MNWKFDFSPETSAVFHVNELLKHTRNLEVSLHEDQIRYRKTYT